MATPSKTLWFSGVCDKILLRVQQWKQFYETGEVFATREYINPVTLQPDQWPTKRLNRIPWSAQELRYLVEIMKSLRPKSTTTVDLEKISKHLTRVGKPLGNGYYEIQMAFYPEEINDILSALEEAKSGQTKDLNKVLEEQKSEGLDPFQPKN